MSNTTTSSSSSSNQDVSIFESSLTTDDSIFTTTNEQQQQPSPQPPAAPSLKPQQQPPITKTPEKKPTTAAAPAPTTKTTTSSSSAAAALLSSQTSSSLKPPSPATTVVAKQTLLSSSKAATPAAPTPHKEEIPKNNVDSANFGLQLLGDQAKSHIEAFNSSNLVIRKMIQTAQEAATRNIEMADEGCKKLIEESNADVARRCNATTSLTISMNNTVEQLNTSLKASATSIAQCYNDMMEGITTNFNELLDTMNERFEKEIKLLKRKRIEYDGDEEESDEDGEDEDANGSGSESSQLDDLDEQQTPPLTQVAAKKQKTTAAVSRETIAKRVAQKKAVAVKPQLTITPTATAAAPPKQFAQTTLNGTLKPLTTTTASVLAPIVKKQVQFAPPVVAAKKENVYTGLF
jgi:hypothetical protein